MGYLSFLIYKYNFLILAAPNLSTNIAIYNSKAFKPARTTRPVHCVDSAHYTLYRESLIKGGDYNGVQVMSSSREHNFNQEIFPFLPICVISPISQNTI